MSQGNAGAYFEDMPPIVSIIVVTYNHDEFIDECLASCVEQAADFPSLEIVVADDGSQDGTAQKIMDWASQYPRLIRPALATSNAGIAANFNQGIRASRGGLIAWIGGDDIMLKGKIAKQVQFLEGHPEASGCYHDAQVFAWPSGALLGLFSDLYAGRAARAPHVDVERMLDPRYQMLPSTVMVRRSVMPDSYDQRLYFHNDYLFDLETIVNGGPYVRMDGVFVRYRKHDKSIGQSPKTRAMMLEENLMVCAIAEARHPGLAVKIGKRAVYYLSLEAVRSVQAGEHARARQLCWALISRGAIARALFVFVFGKALARLATPEYRGLAVKIRSIFG